MIKEMERWDGGPPTQSSSNLGTLSRTSCITNLSEFLEDSDKCNFPAIGVLGHCLLRRIICYIQMNNYKYSDTTFIKPRGT